MTSHAAMQLAIGILGAVSIWLTVTPHPAWRRWACVFGLAAQPLWLYSTATTAQWGMFALALCYTAAWAFDAVNQWGPVITAHRERSTWRWLAHLWRGRE